MPVSVLLKVGMSVCHFSIKCVKSKTEANFDPVCTFVFKVCRVIYENSDDKIWLSNTTL